MSLQYEFDPRHFAAFFISVAVISQIRLGYFQGIKNFIRSRDWKEIYGFFLFIPIVIGFLFFGDEPIRAVVLAPENKIWIHELAAFGRTISNNARFWLILTSAYFLFLILRKKRVMESIFSLLVSSALTGLSCHILKFVFFRARPYTEFGNKAFWSIRSFLHPPTGFERDAFESMPSGDVSLIAGAACYAFWRVKHPALRLFIVIFPLLTALSRVYENKHWPSDTIASAGIGLLISYLVLKFEKSKADAIK